MPGKRTSLTPLELRKQLLIAESELNRIELLAEWEPLSNGIHAFAERTNSIHAIASSLISLGMGGLTSYFNRRSSAAAGKTSWFSKLMTGVRIASSAWLALRSFSAREKSE